MGARPGARISSASKSTRSLAFALASAALVSAAPAAAECDAWTFLPDLRCEERSARPSNAFGPMGMPYLFEDPYITTGLNFVYVRHELPENGVFLGGTVNVAALQIRVALTDRIALIATKDGVTIFRPDNPIVEDDTGFMDMTLGLKASLVELPESNFILSGALRYEIPLGNEGVYQGYGDGVIIPSASFRWGLGALGLENANVVGSLGGQVPIDDKANSESLFWNLHLDYGFEVANSTVTHVVPFVEVNGIHYTKSGDGTNPIHLSGGGTLPLGTVQTVLATGPFEGADVANLGSPNIGGHDLVTFGGGLRFPTKLGISFGIMYEAAVSERDDIYDRRLTAMATWEL